MDALRISSIGVLCALSACSQMPARLASGRATLPITEFGNAQAETNTSTTDLQQLYAAEAIPPLQTEPSRIVAMPVDWIRKEKENDTAFCVTGEWVLIHYNQNCGPGSWYAGVSAEDRADLMHSIYAVDNAVIAHLSHGQRICVEGTVLNVRTATCMYHVRAARIGRGLREWTIDRCLPALHGPASEMDRRCTLRRALPS